MKLATSALIMVASTAGAQTLPAPGVATHQLPKISTNIVLPPNVTLPPCLGSGPGDAVIGEKVIGEKVIGEKVIGEKVIGEKSAGSASITFGDQWNASQFTSFNHVLVGPPGKLNLNLYGCSSASSGETVSVYLADANGRRKTGWRLFVIGTRNGNNRQGTITLPPAKPGEKVSKLPIVVVVENASGRPHVGEYRLTASH